MVKENRQNLFTIEDNVTMHIDCGMMSYHRADSRSIPSTKTASDLKSTEVPFPTSLNPTFTFIDLFAGIGGFRLALQKLGGECVFSSEWDKYAQTTYRANYGEIPYGDIRDSSVTENIPETFDILCAGFPCQPFSIAGVSKKNSLGRPNGFEDKTQGTLFFEVARIAKKHRPKALFLENVKNLVSHDKGNTFKVILQTLDELNYSVHYKIYNSIYLTPQNRERILIVAFDKSRIDDANFLMPDLTPQRLSVRSILETEVEEKYTLSDKLWSYLRNYAEKHRARGNGFGYGLVDPNGTTRTLSARYYKDGSEILIPQDGKNPRRLTVRECARLMGYPEDFIIDAVSMTQAYKQFGNSVVVPLISDVGKSLTNYILNYVD